MKTKNISPELQEKLSMEIKEFRYHRKWSWFWGIVSVIALGFTVIFITNAILHDVTIYDKECIESLLCIAVFALAFYIFAKNWTSYSSDRDILLKSLPEPVYDLEEEKKKMCYYYESIGIYTFVIIICGCIFFWSIRNMQSPDVMETAYIIFGGGIELFLIYMFTKRLIGYYTAKRIVKKLESN